MMAPFFGINKILAPLKPDFTTIIKYFFQMNTYKNNRNFKTNINFNLSFTIMLFRFR